MPGSFKQMPLRSFPIQVAPTLAAEHCCQPVGPPSRDVVRFLGRWQHPRNSLCREKYPGVQGVEARYRFDCGPCNLRGERVEKKDSAPVEPIFLQLAWKIVRLQVLYPDVPVGMRCLQTFQLGAPVRVFLDENQPVERFVSYFDCPRGRAAHEISDIVIAGQFHAAGSCEGVDVHQLERLGFERRSVSVEIALQYIEFLDSPRPAPVRPMFGCSVRHSISTDFKFLARR